MSAPQLLIDCPVAAALPGGLLEGTVYWTLEKASGPVTLNLGWWTEGRGSRDEEVVASRLWEDPGRVGKESFSFTLPDFPWSFSGSLISLRWALELKVKGVQESVLHPLVLGPAGAEVDVSKHTYESQIKSLFVRHR